MAGGSGQAVGSMSFTLNSRLAKDCLQLGRLELSRLLLMNNAAVPWFILVPEVTVTELCDLEPAQQLLLYSEVNRVAEFVRSSFAVDKLNIAAIGNVVSQLHVHVVGRRRDDYCWPGVVWGAPADERYTAEQVSEISTSAINTLEGLKL